MMTDEGRKKLDSFLESKRKYEQELSSFDKFAKATNARYSDVMRFRRTLFISGGLLIILAFILIYFKDDIGIGMFQGQLCLIIGAVLVLAGTKTNAEEEDIRDLTNRYFAEKGFPGEDKELAMWIFARKQDFSKFPYIQDILMRGLIKESDLDSFNIGFDSDDDFDSDD